MEFFLRCRRVFKVLLSLGIAKGMEGENAFVYELVGRDYSYLYIDFHTEYAYDHQLC